MEPARKEHRVARGCTGELEAVNCLKSCVASKAVLPQKLCCLKSSAAATNYFAAAATFAAAAIFAAAAYYFTETAEARSALKQSS